MNLQISCKAVLCDMDGTLVDSTLAVESIWTHWAALHGLDVAHILAVSHGRRTIDTLREITPHLDIAAEAEALESQELTCGSGVREVPGAAEFLARLPAHRWCLVTSASHPLAEARLRMAGLPIPPVLIGASDVSEGKPNPEGYLLAASALGFAPADCLVLEDTPAGLSAGRAAGCQVLALTTTYSAAQLLGAPAIPHFQNVSVSYEDETLHLHV